MSWTSATEAFKVSLPNYEERVSQAQLAQAMEDAVDAGQPLLGQAPPGTGKSFPAIITLLDSARSLGRTCVVSTATKALQDQYISDCQFIKDNYAPDFKFVVVKGRSNYLCKAKMAKADEVLLDVKLDELTQQAEDPEILGDVERMGLELTSTQRKGLISTTDECPGKAACAFGQQCYSERVKSKSENADVIIVNHAMLAIDATLKSEGVALLPSYPVVVVDEAHELRAYVENALSEEVTQRALTQLNADVASFIDNTDLTSIGDMTFELLFKRFDAVLGNDRDVPLTPAVIVECGPQIKAVYDHLSDLEGKLAVHRVSGDDAVDRKKKLMRRIHKMTLRIQRIIADDFARTVRSLVRDIDPTGRFPSKILFKMQPLDVAPFLAEVMWRETTPLLISATLAVGDDFTFTADEQGLSLLDVPYRTFDCPTPFDFANQAVTYIPEDVPPKSNGEQHANFVHWQSEELIKAADGRTMLLFTSIKAMRDAYTYLEPKVTDMGHRVFIQGQMGPRQLADAFAADEHSVLFATKTFFTGVNIQGDSLRCLIIQKAPFHYPDTLWAARCAALDAKCDERSKWTRGAFPALQVPDMIMTLVQAYGRLIRTMDDKGLVAIFDQVFTERNGTRYGKKVRQDVLVRKIGAPIVGTLGEAVDALKRLDVS